MESILLTVGRWAGTAGVLVTLAAAVGRLVGRYWIGGYQTGTVLLAGMALMLIGCLGFLAVLTSERAPGSS